MGVYVTLWRNLLSVWFMHCVFFEFCFIWNFVEILPLFATALYLLLLLMLQLLAATSRLFISFGCRLRWSSTLLSAGFILSCQNCSSSNLLISCIGIELLLYHHYQHRYSCVYFIGLASGRAAAHTHTYANLMAFLADELGLAGFPLDSSYLYILFNTTSPCPCQEKDGNEGIGLERNNLLKPLTKQPAVLGSPREEAVNMVLCVFILSITAWMYWDAENNSWWKIRRWKKVKVVLYSSEELGMSCLKFYFWIERWGWVIPSLSPHVTFVINLHGALCWARLLPG